MGDGDHSITLHSTADALRELMTMTSDKKERLHMAAEARAAETEANEIDKRFEEFRRTGARPRRGAAFAGTALLGILWRRVDSGYWDAEAVEVATKYLSSHSAGLRTRAFMVLVWRWADEKLGLAPSYPETVLRHLR